MTTVNLPTDRLLWATIARLVAGAVSWRIVGGRGQIDRVIVQAEPPAVNIDIIVPVNLGGAWR